MTSPHGSAHGTEAETGFDGAAVRLGMRNALPLLAPAIPFGLVTGLTVADSVVVSNWAGWSTSWMLFAGSSQIVALRLADQRAAALFIVLAVFMINARHIMYSAAIRGRFVGAPMWFRVIGSYFLIDQVFALDEQMSEEVGLRERMWRFLGAGVFFWVVWLTTSGIGVVAGTGIPEGWSLDFTVPLLFGSLLILGLRDRPGVVAALSAAIVVTATRSWPSGSGLLVAIVVGVIAGGLADAGARSAATRGR